MWKLFDWITNKSAQLDPKDQHKGLNHLNHVLNSRKVDSTTDSACCAEPEDGESRVSAEQLQRQKPRPDGETRRDGMAYWRMNTRREQPSDSLAKSRLTQTGQWHAFSETFRDTRAGQKFNQTISDNLENLGSVLSKDTRANINSGYLNKSQAALDRRGIAYGIDNDVPQPESIESYPHYQGGWEPARLDDNGFVKSTESFEPEVIPNGQAAPVSSSIGDETIYDFPVEPGSLPAQAESATIEQPSLMNLGQVPQELVESLKSVESSPQCDAIFEQSAHSFEETQSLLQERNGQDFNYPLLEDSLADQSTTIDNMPSMQLSEIQIAVADHPATSSDVLLQLAHDTNPDVRFAIAENHNADVEILQLLSQDDNPFVAARARKTLRRVQNGQCMQANFGGRNTVLRKAN